MQRIGMKNISLIFLCLLFIGCETHKQSKTSNEVYQSVYLLEGCAEGLVVYRGNNAYPAMYKRTIDDKLIPCDVNKFKKD